jgi:hypothetical protein
MICLLGRSFSYNIEICKQWDSIGGGDTKVRAHETKEAAVDSGQSPTLTGMSYKPCARATGEVEILPSEIFNPARTCASAPKASFQFVRDHENKQERGVIECECRCSKWLRQAAIWLCHAQWLPVGPRDRKHQTT